ncbi:MAG: hypothetical protein RRB13_09140 [bacterium]|nr:hypothetical protein [bacterium]
MKNLLKIKRTASSTAAEWKQQVNKSIAAHSDAYQVENQRLRAQAVEFAEKVKLG